VKKYLSDTCTERKWEYICTRFSETITFFDQTERQESRGVEKKVSTKFGSRKKSPVCLPPFSTKALKNGSKKVL
jgi:hypothetical protein